MKHQMTRWGTAMLMAVALAGCGGGGSDSTPAPSPAPGSSAVKDRIAAAAALATNDTATNPSAAFSVLNDAGVPAVTVNSPPKVNFTVFSNGAVKSDLKIASVSVIIAKLVPGSNGNPDEWQSYTHRTRDAAKPSATVKYTPEMLATLTNPAYPKQTTAGVDPKQTDAALLAQQLVYNPDGYYTYTFSTDIKDPSKTEGVVFEPNRTHRVAVQLSYTNAAGATIKVNPYFDVTFDASGKAVPVTDPSKTRKMTDVSSCNGCHEKLALHGGGRVDTQFCVTCHNAGSVDANSGGSLNLQTMVHKIHAAKLLRSQLKAGKGGEYVSVRADDFSEVGFPQDLRNCTVCHTGANPATPQGDNWKRVVTKEACLTCHANRTGSDWDNSHKNYAAALVGPGAAAKDLSNQQCATCHKPGGNLGPDRVHWNQNEENGAKYRMNIESATYDAAARKVTVKYYLADPTNGNQAYNLVTSDCTGSGATLACANTTKFGNLRFYLAYQNVVGQSALQTEFSAYNNGGNSANVYAYKGRNDGNNHYSVDITLPADTATAVAFGTARVVSIGQIKEPKLEVKWATDPRPEVSPKVLVNTVVQHTFTELALTGTLQPRRTIVANAKCNVCHGALGTTSGSNTLAEAFHGGARNTVEACVVCHDANRASSTVMTNGLALNESYQFKRMIHGIHGNSQRSYPFTHGNTVVGAFNKDGSSISGGDPLAASVENYAAEVAWPGVGLNCNACHVDNSYKSDLGTLGSVVKKDSGVTDPNLWKVISPKAASCTACHDSGKTLGHVTSFGGATFGDRTQAQVAALPRETCDDCHAPGGFKGVDIVHGQK